jgi:hypothetical protein
LPIEAVLSEPAGEYMDPAHEADAEILEDAEEYDMESEDMNEEDFRVCIRLEKVSILALYHCTKFCPPRSDISELWTIGIFGRMHLSRS